MASVSATARFKRLAKTRTASGLAIAGISSHALTAAGADVMRYHYLFAGLIVGVLHNLFQSFNKFLWRKNYFSKQDMAA